MRIFDLAITASKC